MCITWGRIQHYPRHIDWVCSWLQLCHWCWESNTYFLNIYPLTFCKCKLLKYVYLWEGYDDVLQVITYRYVCMLSRYTRWVHVYIPLGIHVYRLHLLARVARVMIQHILAQTIFQSPDMLVQCGISPYMVLMRIIAAILVDMLHHRYLQDSPDMCVWAPIVPDWGCI